MIEIGIDVGGTFTDVVLLDRAAGRLEVAKTASTPKDQSIGILNGLARLAVDPGTIHRFAHGSTVATNTVLERKGARVALLTTAGFRDLLEIGRQTRPHMYDMQIDHAPPLVGREHRLEGIAVRAAVPEELDDVDLAVGRRRQRRVDLQVVLACNRNVTLGDRQRQAGRPRSGGDAAANHRGRELTTFHA